MIATRKLKLTILNENEEQRNKQYKFIRDSRYAQYQGLNICMGYLMSEYFRCNRNIKSEEFKKAQKSITNSNPIFEGIEFGKGIDSKSLITQKVKSDFKIALKNGLASGKRSCTNYKYTFPLMTRGRDLKFQYSSEISNEIIIKWVNKIVFKVVLGERENENIIELKHTLNKVINNEYKVKGGSLYFDKENNLILNLTIDIPERNNKYEPVKGRVLGVDLGIKYPVYICLNDDTYKRRSIGTIEDFLRVREQMQQRRSRVQKSLILAKGGRGRKKKLRKLDKIKESEKNFVQTYNHMVSKKVIEFALKNRCEYIYLEELDKEGFSSPILRNWSYYQLQQYIEYKANREGIKVEYVNPAYTSQTCSRCGCRDEKNRQTQEKFKCVKCGFELNADHNAAINIARGGVEK